MFFFFNDTATTEIYTLSLHDALPISKLRERRIPYTEAKRTFSVKRRSSCFIPVGPFFPKPLGKKGDRKSTRLNSSHANISYAVFCLKKKKTKKCFILLKI